MTPGSSSLSTLGGITTTAGARSGRKILVQVGVDVGTLVHEACHFYVHNNFTQMIAARKDSEEYLRGASTTFGRMSPLGAAQGGNGCPLKLVIQAPLFAERFDFAGAPLREQVMCAGSKVSGLENGFLF